MDVVAKDSIAFLATRGAPPSIAALEQSWDEAVEPYKPNQWMLLQRWHRVSCHTWSISISSSEDRSWYEAVGLDQEIVVKGGIAFLLHVEHLYQQQHLSRAGTKRWIGSSHFNEAPH